VLSDGLLLQLICSLRGHTHKVQLTVLVKSTFARRMYLTVLWHLCHSQYCGAFSPHGNYTNWATTVAGEVVPTFASTCCCVISATNPYGHYPSFLNQIRYFFNKWSPLLSSGGWMAAIRDHYSSENPVGLGKTRDLSICSQELRLLTHRGGLTSILWRVWSNAAVAMIPKVRHTCRCYES
jgi:hypothetical protein